MRRSSHAAFRTWLQTCVLLLWCLNCAAKDIVVAQLVPLSGPVGEAGRQFSAGAALVFDQANRNGGIAGRPLRHMVLDDRYEVPTSLQHLTQLLSAPELPCALLSFGTASTLAVAQELDKRHIGLPVFPTGSGATPLRQPFNRNLFHVRASYALEFEKLINIFATTGLKSFALVYMDDAFGHDARRAVQGTLAALGLPAAIEFKHERGQQDISALADAVLNARPSVEAVLLAENPAPAASFIRRAHDVKLRARMASISDIEPKELFERVGPAAARYVVLSQSMPNPMDESLPMVADFRRLVRQTGGKLQPNAYALEGYVQARVIVEGLRRSADPSAATLARALEAIRSLDLGGYYISFGTSSHEGASFVDTTIISENGRVRH